jgi:hypothetical protein
MSLDTTGMLDSIVSHAMRLGLFERVNTSEPKNSPGNGLTAAVWLQMLGPVPVGSGLASTSARVEFMLRIYSNMLAEPQDAIDPEILAALDVLMGAYSGDFDLGGTVRNVDLLGAHGVGLSAVAGYLAVDNKMFRVVDLTLPLIVNDVWDQVA